MATPPQAHDIAGEVRAELARRRVKAYKVAARLDLHPVNLSAILNGHRPMSPEFAGRVMLAIEEEAAAK